MAEPLCARGSFDNGEIGAEMPLSDVAASVLSGRIVVLKGVFANQRDDLRTLRRAIFDWARTTQPSPNPLPTENTHCIQSGVSQFQQTPHVYHSYNFNRISQLPQPLSAHLRTYFEPLCALQNELTGNDARLEALERAPALHPQVIQYPAGGGIFGRHHHPLEPQRIGLILALSQRGADFDQGGTGFEVDGDVVDLEAYHDLGDIALFRFDIPHWVRPSDLRENFDWRSERGRWTMVLPYY
jgi:hypothetical protein